MSPQEVRKERTTSKMAASSTEYTELYEIRRIETVPEDKTTAPPTASLVLEPSVKMARPGWEVC